jgi:hypothetical protein
MGGIYLSMRFIHRRPLLTLVTPAPSLSWKRLFQGFGVWFGLVALMSLVEALVYPGRYLYKGLIQEKDIPACRDGLVTFRYQDSKTKKMQTRTLPGPKFLWLILQHVLPKGVGAD